MKAQLTFNLPEEDREHRVAVDAMQWCDVVWEMDQFLKQQIKAGRWPDGSQISEHDADYMRKTLHRLLEERNLRFD